MAKRKPLDPYTLRWVHRQARRGHVPLALNSNERAFNEALDFLGDRCLEKAKSLEARALKPAKRAKR